MARCQQEGRWEAVLRWTGEALATLPANSRSRPPLEEARGQALLRLDRPAEALAVFQALFPRQETAPVYLALRAAALTAGQWEEVGPEVRADLRQRVLDQVRTLDQERAPGYSFDVPAAASLLGFAYLLEGQWSEAVVWALHPALPSQSYTGDLLQTVATGLLRLALAGQAGPGDEALALQLRQPPAVIREHGDQLDPVGRGLPAEPMLDAAVRLYERLVAVNCQGGGRPTYAQADVYCTVIRAIRRLQGREAEFAAFYQGLFATYSRYPALKDELRKAVEGPDYRKKR